MIDAAHRLRAPRVARATAALLAALALLIPFILAPGGTPAQPVDPQRPASELGRPALETASDRVMQKVDAAVRSAVDAAQGPEELVPVIVVSMGSSVSTGLVDAVSRKPDANGLVFTYGKAKAGLVGKAAAADNVLAILSGVPPAAPWPADLPSRSTGNRVRPDKAGGKSPAPAQAIAPATTADQPADPDSWHTLDVQNVRAAWQQGYKGQGVKVALLDSGVDFGHPDLMDTYARVDDPNSPYYGWPMAFDPHSMMLYAGGIVGDIENAIQAYGSWFVDTSAVIHGEQGDFTTVTATPSGMDPVTHTYTLPGTSKSGVYHIGIFPDEHLAFDRYAEYPAMVVADEHTAGVYDTVYVDLLDDRDFRNDTPLRKGAEVATADVNGDKVPDISTGMLYFIADGVHPVPASDWLYGTLPPGNGELVAMMGSYNYGEDHGTFCASSIVAQGVIDGPNFGLRPPYKPANAGGMVQGMAPQAKLIAVGDIYRSGSSFYDAYAIITYGLDGRPGTGDEPQIVSASYGFSGGSDNGWDYQSRYLTYLSHLTPNQLVVFSTGNGGPGYGSVTPPAAAPSVLSVGAATQYGELTLFEPISATSRITWGDVQPWSNRGPSSLGVPEPDVLSIGAWGTGDVAPNAVRDGANAYDNWGGTSMSTPVTAGIMALGYQAFKQQHGRWPTSQEAREMATSSARDLGYGSFSQGAGLLDARRVVDLAAGQRGFSVSPGTWVPGQTAPAFTGYVLPGQSVTRTFTVTNPTSQPLTVQVNAERMVEISHFDWSVVTSNTKESSPDFTRPDYIFDLENRVPDGTDLMKVTAVMSYTQFTLSNPRDPWIFWHSAWRLLAYQWHDNNGNGRIWTDLSGNGVVNDGELDRGEYNRLWYAYPKQDILEGYIADPLARGGDGVLIGLQHQIDAPQVPSTTIRLRVTFYRHEPWSLATVAPSSLTVPARGSRSFVAGVAVPADAAPGAYEAALRLQGGSQDTVVPVALNVASPSLPTTFGGTPPQGTTYDNGRMSGAGDWSWRPETGEWRYFFALNQHEPDAHTYLWTHTNWPTYPTDIDTAVLGAVPWDWFSNRDPATFGPYGMAGLSGSRSQYLGGAIWEWETSSGHTSEWLSSPVFSAGLHEVVLHDTWYSGAGFSEPFTGTLGTVHLSRDSLDIDSDSPQATSVFTFTTDVDLPGIAATGFGLSQVERHPNIVILPLHTYFYELTLTDTASIEFRTSSRQPIDVDLYVDHWNGERFEWLAGSSGPGADEFIRLEPALDGKYRIRVDASRFVSPNGSAFDLDIKAVHGHELRVTPAIISDTIAAGTTLTFTVGFDRPNIRPGAYDGKVFLGVPEAPALLSLPVNVIYGNPPPSPTPTPNPCVPGLADIPDDYWAAQYVNYLWCRGVVSGYLDRTFRPANYTSRVQFAKVLVLALGWGTVSPETPTFRDVPPNYWGYEFVETAAEHGAVAGYADGTFRPIAPVTRAQVAKILVLSSPAQAPPPTPAASFSDAGPDHWAYPYIQEAAARGLISGYADGTFRPAALATRAQLSKMVYLLMREIGR